MLLPCASNLRAQRDLGVDFESGEHALVEGDNLEVLKLLASSCAGTVDLVYIDPPYNRGHDRLYPDDYSVTRKDYAARSTTGDDGASGHLHAQWLSLMAPRLALARELLHETGIIAVSIDQLEVSRLRLLMEELFGEENFVAEIVVSLNPKGRQLAPFFATSHEYLLVFARDFRKTALVAASKESVDPSDFPRADERGRYRLLPLRNTNKKFNPTSSRSMHFAVWAHPRDGRVRAEPFEDAVEVWPVFGDGSSAVWRWSARRIESDCDQLVARQVKGRGGARLDVYQIDRLTPERTKKLRTIWTSAEVGSTDDAVSQLKALVGPVFPTPKPVGLLRRLLATMPKDSVVLDFFAGSGTTGQAVIEANADDGGTRRCVLVQAVEPTEPGGEAAQRGLASIAAIAAARMRATIERCRAARASGVPGPGLRVFELSPAAPEAGLDDDRELLVQVFRRRS
ncbi:MAG: site-specific DNA-methyltransferase [Planctomycetota bacterium]|nr:site-specific DNA-methyltransferase [Planctomycetota bacterium]